MLLSLLNEICHVFVLLVLARPLSGMECKGSAKSSSSPPSTANTRYTELLGRAQSIYPNMDFSICTSSALDSSLDVKCTFRGNKFQNCPNGHPDAREAFVINCLAYALIANGFQIPVHVIAGPYPKRREKIGDMLKAATFLHIEYRDDFVIGNINKTRMDELIFQVPPKGKGATQEQTNQCIENIDSSINNREVATRECEELGTRLDDREVSLTMKHVAVHEGLFKCKDGEMFCFSPGPDPKLRFALVVEDDQHLPRSMLRQLAEIIIGAPADVGLFMLDDSYHDARYAIPPGHLHGTFFTNSYEKGRSRTCGAYLLSQDVINTFFNNGHWVPQIRVIDHSFNYIIKKEHLKGYWAHPPVSCHGTRMETYGNGCSYCCAQYYDLNSMTPHLSQMTMVDKQGKVVLGC